MQGSEEVTPRCTALVGVVGKKNHCSVYENRPSPCRNFAPSYELGVHNERCDQARAGHGLSALTQLNWLGPDLVA
jgi:uncharacterized protein